MYNLFVKTETCKSVHCYFRFEIKLQKKGKYVLLISLTLYRKCVVLLFIDETKLKNIFFIWHFDEKS